MPDIPKVNITINIFPGKFIFPKSIRYILLTTLNMNGCKIQIPVLVDNILIIRGENSIDIPLTNKNKAITPVTTGIDAYIVDAHVLLIKLESIFKPKTEVDKIIIKIALLYFVPIFLYETQVQKSYHL